MTSLSRLSTSNSPHQLFHGSCNIGTYEKASSENAQLHLFKRIWNTFTALGTPCDRINIVFNIYLNQRIKASKRIRRVSDDGMEILISSLNLTGLASKSKTALHKKFSLEI